MTTINMIVAVAQNDVIGKDNGLPWHIPEDLKIFKELTMGGILFVGKKTAATLPPFKGREIVILDRQTNTLANIKDFAINSIAWKNKALWLIGGAAIYEAALEMNIVDKVYLTRIYRDYKGDTFFSTKRFNETSKEWKLINKRTVREMDPFVVIEEWDRLR